MRRSRLVEAILVSVLVTLFGGSPAAVAQVDAVEYWYADFVESSTNYRGATARWTDETWSSIPCTSQINFVAQVVNADGSAYGTWVQMGFVQRKLRNCSTSIHYYWEWQSTTDYAQGKISSPSPRGTHYFTLERKTTGCASGVSYCWHQIIDGSTKHTCCGNMSIFNPSPLVDTYLECKDTVGDNDCDAVGLVDPISFLRYKNTSDLWYYWAGQDFECVDYNQSARGKWITSSSAKGGFNISMSGSITNPC